MPRSVAKSRTDKGRRRQSSFQGTPPQSSTQDSEVEDLIPPRLTQAQWMEIEIQEDTDETVGEIMEELMRKVMEGCLNVDITKQLIPFSASWAISYLTQSLEQQLLCLDEGDGLEVASKTEDSEPVPTAPEPWAQGCVPVVNVTPQSVSKQEVDIGQTSQQQAPEISQKCNVVVQTRSTPKQSVKEASPGKPLIEKHYKAPSQSLLPKVYLKKKQPLLPRPAQDTIPPPLSCSTEKMDVEVKHENTECSDSHHTSRSYKHKDHQSIPRLDPSRLPRLQILPQYQILDNKYTRTNVKKSSELSTLARRHKKQISDVKAASVKPLTNFENQPDKFHMENKADYMLKKRSPSSSSVEGMLSSGLVSLDKMKLSKGVVLLDLQKVDINCLEVKSPALSTKLRRMQCDEVVPLYSVEQVTGGPPPQLTPLFQPKGWDK